MGKKRQQPNPPKQPLFKSTPFSALKAVAIPLSAPPPRKPEPSDTVAPPAASNEADNDLFLQAMGGVRPLGADQSAVRPVARADKPAHAAPATPVVDEVNPAEQEAFAQAIGQLKLDVTFSDRFPEESELKPLGANRLRQLKKGIIRVDRQLDLHGLTRGEALEALRRFLHNARVHGEKAVLVITGKGLNSPGEPVLLQAVSSWMRDAGKAYVLEFAPAPREMGGGGAFVVFLRE